MRLLAFHRRWKVARGSPAFSPMAVGASFSLLTIKEGEAGFHPRPSLFANSQQIVIGHTLIAQSIEEDGCCFLSIFAMKVCSMTSMTL